MRKRARKASAAELLVSPPPTTSPNPSMSESPKEFEFNLNTFNTNSSSKKKSNNIFNNVNCGASASVLMQPTGSSPSDLKTLSTISDLKELASYRLDSIKRQLDCSHSEIVKDIEASQSRLNKRFKIQTQACQQVMDNAEKEYKKTTERISESQEAIKGSFAEFIAEAQASASRVCKTSIPELSQSFEKAVDVLRSRYGISSTSA